MARFTATPLLAPVLMTIVNAERVRATPLKEWRYADDKVQREKELEIATHEAAHAVVAVAVGDIVEEVTFSRRHMCGEAPYFPREAMTIGSLIAEVAVRLAGRRGSELADGDVLAAFYGSQTDRDDVDELLTAAARRLPGIDASTIAEMAEQVIEAVLRAAWPSVKEIARRLVRDGRVDGAEVHRIVRLPRHIVEQVRRVVA